MPRIIIQGLAAVFRDDEQVTDATVLSSLVPLAYEDEVFTDFLGGTPVEDALAAALDRSGWLTFKHSPLSTLLTVAVEFVAKRSLTTAEIAALVADTLGQWSDGIGENWTCISPGRIGYSIMCLTPGDGDLPSPYPSVTVQA